MDVIYNGFIKNEPISIIVDSHMSSIKTHWVHDNLDLSDLSIRVPPEGSIYYAPPFTGKTSLKDELTFDGDRIDSIIDFMKSKDKPEYSVVFTNNHTEDCDIWFISTFERKFTFLKTKIHNDEEFMNAFLRVNMTNFEYGLAKTLSDKDLKDSFWLIFLQSYSKLDHLRDSFICKDVLPFKVSFGKDILFLTSPNFDKSTKTINLKQYKEEVRNCYPWSKLHQ